MNMLMHMNNGMFEGLKMTSREIAEVSGKRHDHVMRDIKVLIDRGDILAPNFGEQPYKFVGPGGGMREGQEYVLDFKATMLLITGYDSTRRAAVITRWMELEEKQQQPAPEFKIPQTLSEALIMAGELQRQIELDAPKVEYAETVMESPDSMNLTMTAKSLGIGRNKFTKYLRDVGMLYKDSSSNLPIQKYVDKGIFEVKTVVSNTGYMTTQTFVTGKGQEFLQKKLSQRVAYVDF